MSWLASLVLSLFHAVYYVINVFASLRASRSRPPKPLNAARKQLPTHLALLFATDRDSAAESFEEYLLENIQQAISWCRAVGIQRLTVYDRGGEFPDKFYRPHFSDDSTMHRVITFFILRAAGKAVQRQHGRRSVRS